MRRFLFLVRSFLPRQRAHSRALGPVVINPDVQETVHVYGNPEYSRLDRMDGLK